MVSINEMDPINPSKIQPPITFSATNAKLLSKFPNSLDELWSADIKACRHGVLSDVFEGILFVESTCTNSGAAYIFGIEFENGYPEGFNQKLAEKQQIFIRFLRAENTKDDAALGWTRILFSGHEYACEGKATAAYLAERKSKLNIGVGYRNEEGKYILEAIEPDGWI